MKYIEKPNIVTEAVGLVIVDYKVAESMKQKIKEQGIKIVESIACNHLLESIDSHPDMMLCHIGKDKIVVAPEIYEYYKVILNPMGFEIIKGKTVLNEKYPKDIAYDILIVGKIAIHKEKSTDPVIKEELNKQGIKLINVAQGYSKCSTCILNEKLAISSDIKIAKILNSNGVETFYFESKEIKLRGMNNGFIGGATGMIDRNTMAIYGNIDKISKGKELKDFLFEKDIKIVELACDAPEDFGSIVSLMYR